MYCAFGCVLCSAAQQVCGESLFFSNPQVEMSDCLTTFQQAPAKIYKAIITYALDVRGPATLSRSYVNVWVKRWKKTTTLSEKMHLTLTFDEIPR